MTSKENYFKCCKVKFIANYNREEGEYYGSLIFRNCTLETKEKVALLYGQNKELLGAFSLDSSFIVEDDDR